HVRERPDRRARGDGRRHTDHRQPRGQSRGNRGRRCLRAACACRRRGGPGRGVDRSRGLAVGDHRSLALRAAAAADHGRHRARLPRAVRGMTTRRHARTPRVTVVTSGHLSTCPRMLKSADAFAAAGYDVRVVATCHEPWAAETDRDLRSRRAWPVDVIDYRRGDSGSTYWRTGVRYRLARRAAAHRGPFRTPFGIVARAFGRVHSEIVRAAVSAPCDLLYGGTTGALAAIAEAARRQSIPYGIDLEDWHSGESSGPEA